MAEVEIDGAEAPAAAAPPPEEPPKKCSSPKSMYEICLKAFVRNPEMRLIRFLPPSVIIDMFQTVSWPSPLCTVILAQCLTEIEPRVRS